MKQSPSLAGLLAALGLAAPLKAAGYGAAVAPVQPQPEPLSPTAAKADSPTAAVALPTYTVTGESESLAGSGLKFTGPLVYTPQAITVVNQKTMQEQAITSIRDALRDVSGLSIQAGESAQQGDVANIDGFKTDHDFFLDGIRDFGSYYRDPYNLSEIQVLKGPDGLLFGDGSTGGVINQVSKQPEPGSEYEVELDGGTDGTRRAVADLNVPLPELGEHTAFRLDALDDQGGVAQRNDAENADAGLAPSLEFGLGTPTRLTLDYFHLDQHDTPDYGVPWILNQAAPVDRQNYYGFANDYFDASVDIGTLGLEHDFQDGALLKSRVRYSGDSEDWRITEPQVNAPYADEYVEGLLPLSQITTTSNEIQGTRSEYALDNQNDLSRTFKGELSDTLQGGTEEEIQTSAPTNYTQSGVPGQSLVDPDEALLFSGSGVPTPKTQAYAQVNVLAVYGLDTLDLGEHWELIGGLRYDHEDAYYTNSGTSGPGAFRASYNMPDWKGVALFKPVPGASLYYAAGTSTDPSAEQLSLTEGDAATPPEWTLSDQVGAKWDVPDGPELTASLFYNLMDNTQQLDPTTQLDVDTGSELAKGVDLGADGHLTRDWELQAGYTGMRTEYLDYVDNGVSYVGQSLQNSPNNTVGLWSVYHLPLGWQVGAGLDAVGARNAGTMVEMPDGAEVMETAPGYVTYRAMLGYQVSKDLNVQANLDNLTDTDYLDSIQGGHVVPGAGRTLMVSGDLKY